MTTEMVVFDTETTAADPESARIVSAYLGLLGADGSVRMGSEWIVKPEGFTVPAEATAIHGISHELAVTEGIPLSDLLEIVGQILHDYCSLQRIPLAGQNIGYDLTVLDREAERTWPEAPGVGALLQGVAVLDTYVLDKQLYRFRKGSGARKLVNLAASYGVALSEAEAHGAQADAIAAGRIAQVQLTKPSLRGMHLPQIHDAQIRWRAEQAADLEKWFRTKAPPERRDPAMVIDRSWPYIPRPTTTKEAA